MSNIENIFRMSHPQDNAPHHIKEVIGKVMALLFWDTKGKLCQHESAVLSSPDFYKFLGFAIKNLRHPSRAVENFIMLEIEKRERLFLEISECKSKIKELLEYIKNNKIKITDFQIKEHIFDNFNKCSSNETLLDCLDKCQLCITSLNALIEDYDDLDIKEELAVEKIEDDILKLEKDEQKLRTIRRTKNSISMPNPDYPFSKVPTPISRSMAKKIEMEENAEKMFTGRLSPIRNSFSSSNYMSMDSFNDD